MANPVLIIIAIIFLFLMAIANLYLLIYFQHEEDKNTAIFPKIIVVIGLTLTCANVLMLPLDVANTNGGRFDGGLPMETLWLISYILTGIVAIGIIPFTIFYYEAEDPTAGNVSQIKTAVAWEIGCIIVFMITTVILYFTLGVAQVPVTILEAQWQDANDSTSCNQCQELKDQEVEYRVSFALYLVSMLTFAGLFLFILFGGIGLAALPIDLIYGFKSRPKFMSTKDYESRKKKIGEVSSVLIQKGHKLQDKLKMTGGRPKSRKDRKDYNKFKANVFLLEEEFNRVEKSYNKGIGPKLGTIIWGYSQLVLGILGVILSFLWILHVLLYHVVDPAPTPFLNVLFIELDKAFGLFGTLAYALFSFYLLWCVVKGNFKFGVRVPFLFSIHPMKVGATLMNSFLFNTLLILLCSMAIVQFCAAAFSQYSRFTGIDIIFNVGVRNLAGIKYVWLYYYWVIVILAVFTAFVLLIKPDRKRKKRQEAV